MSENNVEVVESLFVSSVNLTVSINVNALKGDGTEGQTALHIASAHGHLEVVQWLLTHGANVNMYDQDPLGSAAALHLAARGAHVEAVRALLDAGAEVNARGAVIGGTALHQVLWQRERGPLGGTVEDQHIQTIMLLLDRGADILARDEEMGDTVVSKSSPSPIPQGF